MATTKDHTTFSDAAIARAIAELSGYEAEETLVTMYVTDMDAVVLTKFAELAKALGVTVTSKYGNLTLARRLPADKLRANAVANLQRAYERGDIDIDGNPFS